MSIFGMAQESADLGYENEAPMANGEETHTVANEIAEVQNLQFEAADEDEAADKLENEAEQTEEVAEVLEEDVAQERALDPTAAKLLKLTFRNIVGKQYADRTLPATESFNGSRSEAREQTRMALEGVKETLKKFWEAIKAQFKKVYEKVKSWIIKTFSAAKKLGERAKKLQSKANDTVGTIEEKSFSFGQTKTIAVDGKYNDAATLTTGLNNVRKWIVGNLTVQKSDVYERVVEEAQTLIEKSIKEAANGSASHAGFENVIKKLKEAGHVAIAPLGSQKLDTKLEEMYKGGKDSNDIVSASISLPGGKAIVRIYVAGDDGATVAGLTKVIKNTRLVLANDKYTPRDVSEGDVKTLTTSQIDKVCDDVIEIAESSYTYQKAWEKREKFQAKLEREIDSIVKDVNSDNDDKNDNRAEREVRDYATAFTTSVRRRTTFESQFISYALNVGSAMLNYSERSLAQHKAK